MENQEQNPIYKKFMKSYKVFNANQIEGLGEKYYKVLSTENNTKELEKRDQILHDMALEVNEST